MMRSNNLTKAALAGFSLALALGGCSSTNDNPGSGTGGASSSHGGTTGSGGSGAAGTTGQAGATGQAGTTGSGGGGATAGGGSSAAGTTGTGGGASGTAGVTGTGGTSGSGGSGGSTGGGAEGGRGGSGTGGRGGNGGGAGGVTGAGGHGGTTGSGGTAGGGSGTFTLTSPSLVDGAKFDGKYTCNGGALGGGVNPELDWAGVPAGTKSLAMTFIDTTLGEDSQFGQHWAIWNIPWDPSTSKVSMFPEALGMTLTGDLATAKQSGKFLAPCAQSVMNNMDDQYAFTLYALSTTTLNITGSTVANALTALRASTATTLGKVVLHGHAGLKGK